MADIKIKIKNLPQIKAAFRKSPLLMNLALKEAILKSTYLVQRESMINSPVDTGNLRASHRSTFSGSGLQLAGTITPNANYAIFVHDGTRFIKGRPFLFDAVESSDGQIQEFFTDAVQNALNKIGRMT